jgi:hypothetical protein
MAFTGRLRTTYMQMQAASYLGASVILTVLVTEKHPTAPNFIGVYTTHDRVARSETS